VKDPRPYQIAVLSGLLVWGTWGLHFEIVGLHAVVALVTAQLTQWACSRAAKVPFDPRSALISSLSLCLLLRCDAPWLMAVAAVITIASKFVLRVNGRHVFNPTNLGIGVMLLLTPRVWVSGGQWGHAALFVLLLASAGVFVVSKAARADVTVAFLLTYAGVLFARAASLGDPFTIPLHQLTNGALVLFAFFMISDPKTTPLDPVARVVFGVLVALVARYVRFTLFHTNDLIWALLLMSPVVPLLDLLAARLTWWRSWRLT
jgi:Na+-translocating ferredoxin:NAD+ oxidoreductase RnfD subunit